MVKKVTINQSLDLTCENGYFLQEISGLGYRTRFSVNQILSRHGARLGNAVFNNKAVRIVIAVIGETPSDLISKRNEVFKRITLDNYSTDDKLRFDFTLSNNQQLMIEGVVENVDQPISTGTQVESIISISLETEYPFLQSNKIYSITVPISRGGGAAVPMTIPLDFTQGAGSGYTIVPNGGNVFSFPKIRFNGPLTNPTLIDVLNDKQITIADTILEDEYIEVDTYNQTVLDQDESNKLSAKTGEYLIVPASTDNRFRLATSEVGDTGYVSMIYPYSYVAI